MGKFCLPENSVFTICWENLVKVPYIYVREKNISLHIKEKIAGKIWSRSHIYMYDMKVICWENLVKVPYIHVRHEGYLLGKFGQGPIYTCTDMKVICLENLVKVPYIHVRT